MHNLTIFLSNYYSIVLTYFSTIRSLSSHAPNCFLSLLVLQDKFHKILGYIAYHVAIQ